LASRGFRRLVERRRRGDVRGDRGRAGRPRIARKSRPGRFIRSQRLSVVQRPMATGATSPSSRRSALRANDRHRRRPPRQVSGRVGWGAIGWTSRRWTASSRASLDVGWSGTAGADTPDNVVVTSQDELHGWRRGQAPHRFRLRRQGDGRGWSATKSSASSTSILYPATTSCRCGRGRLGPGAYAVALTHRPLDVGAEAYARRALGLGLVRQSIAVARARRQA